MPTRHIPLLPPELDVETIELPIVMGPWMQDHWVIVDVAGDRRRRIADQCDAIDCDGVAMTFGLCHGHYWRWRREGEPALESWIAHPQTPIAAKRNDRSRRVFDFTLLPQRARSEIRYVIGHKLSNGDWTPNANLRSTLEVLSGLLLSHRHSSFTERRPEDWVILARELRPSAAAFDRNERPYIHSFFATLHRGLITDPWAEDAWLWLNMFDRILEPRSSESRASIRWDSITQIWLREAIKLHARESLVSGRREWGTILNWAKAFGRFSKFLEQRQVTEPAQVNRKLFLLHLEEQRVLRANSTTMKQEVNILAVLLSDLRVDELLPDLGSEVFLRQGENRVDRIRAPRPWPRDVLSRIDQRILESDTINPELRLMLRFCRWSGPRISELVTLPNDCVKVTRSGGFWIEYWMPKVKRHRRFPVPDVLGKQLVAQSVAVRELYGPDAPFMFPQRVRSNVTTGVARPWSKSGFGGRVAELFTEHGILDSKLTGEPVSGAEIHRFRHTIGTELLNNGWTQHEVMEFLGHASPVMTANYARINDDTLSRKIGDFHRDATTFQSTYGDADPQVEKMRARITAVTPSGFCTLPATQNCDVRSNPCLSCAFFSKGDGSFDENRGVYRTQLRATVLRATAEGDPAIAELNQAILDDLEALEGS